MNLLRMVMQTKRTGSSSLTRTVPAKLAFQQVEHLERTTWPEHDVPMQMHVDFTVSSFKELQRHRDRAESLGAQLLLDRTADSNEPLYVLADPSGHPFCIFVA